MIHVWGHAFPGGHGPDIDDGLGGDPGRGKAHFSGSELLEPQDLQAEHVAIKVDRLFNVLGVHHHMVQSHHVHSPDSRASAAYYAACRGASTRNTM
jgi:hypothetical protein